MRVAHAATLKCQPSLARSLSDLAGITDSGVAADRGGSDMVDEFPDARAWLGPSDLN